MGLSFERKRDLLASMKERAPRGRKGRGLGCAPSSRLLRRCRLCVGLGRLRLGWRWGGGWWLLLVLRWVVSRSFSRLVLWFYVCVCLAVCLFSCLLCSQRGYKMEQRSVENGNIEQKEREVQVDKGGKKNCVVQSKLSLVSRLHTRNLTRRGKKNNTTFINGDR